MMLHRRNPVHLFEAFERGPYASASRATVVPEP